MSREYEARAREFLTREVLGRSVNDRMASALAALLAEVTGEARAAERQPAKCLDNSISCFGYDGSGVREALIARRDEARAFERQGKAAATAASTPTPAPANLEERE